MTISQNKLTVQKYMDAFAKSDHVFGKAVGLEITVFNPALAADGSIARRFVRSIADGLATYGRI